MEQHPVPQHIASFEFKLFGNLTIRQFITLAIPMSLAILVYFSSLPTVPRISLSGAIALFAFFAAFVPVQGRPLNRWVMAFVKAVLAPTQRIWIKEPKIPEFLSIVTAPPIKEKPNEMITTLSREKLFDYLRSLPTKNLSPLDVKEQLALERLGLEGGRGVSAGSPRFAGETGKLPPAIIWSTLTSMQQPQAVHAQVLPAQEEYEQGLKQALPPQDSIGQMPIPKIAPHAKPYALPGLEKKLEAKKAENEHIELVSSLGQGKPLETEIPSRRLASEINYTQEFVIPLRTADNQIKLVPGVSKPRVRKLHFGPPIGFDISKLPIRGERRFEISEELKKRFHFEEALPEGQAPPVVLPIEQPIPPGQRPSLQSQRLSESVTGPVASYQLPATKSVPQMKKAHLIPKSNIILQTPQDVTLKTEKKEAIDTKIQARGQKLKITPGATPLVRAQIIPLTNKPNVLSGLIAKKDGTPVESAIFIVRDENGIPVRALKTNKLGQFLSATSLANGQYQVEVESESAKFDPFTINLNGQVVAPLEIKAKE